jgi:nifR3 family TIM-barrel protein
MLDKQKKMKIAELVLSNPLVLAPMSGVTDLPFRIVARKVGCALAFTEMVSAEGLVRKSQTSKALLASCPQDRPLGVQIFGSHPKVMAEAIRMIDDLAVDLIDINMGCPVKKVVNQGAGAALMRDVKNAEAIIREARSATKKPLTLKIRSGWNAQEITAPSLLRIAEQSGVDAITIHPRSRSQGFAARADWSLIKLIKEMASIPIVGNGDVKSPELVAAMLDQTGSDGVMIGRAAMGSPFIFQQSLEYLADPIKKPQPLEFEDRLELIRQHLDLIAQFHHPKHAAHVSHRVLVWYTRGLPRGSTFRRNLAGTREIIEMQLLTRSYFQSLKRFSTKKSYPESFQ